MSDRARSGGLAGATFTMVMPAPEGPFVFKAPEPALVSKHNPEHLGMTTPELQRTLRAMGDDPRFAAEVVKLGRKWSGASPASIVAFLKERPALAAANDGETEEVDGSDVLLAEAGFLPAKTSTRRKAGGCSK